MESRRRPAPRPLPRIIYIRRRVAAAAVLLVVVALIVWLMVSLSHRPGDTPAPVATTTPAVATSESSMSATASSTVESTSMSASSSPTVTTLAAPTTTVVSMQPTKSTCDVADLVITATSDKAVYGPGEMPKFYMTVTNPTSADCVVDLDRNLLRFEVYDLSTNKLVWSDIDCNDSEGAGTVTFAAGKSSYYEAVWSRKGSAPGQCDNRRPVPAGGYYLHTLIGSNHSDAHTFNLN